MSTQNIVPVLEVETNNFYLSLEEMEQSLFNANRTMKTLKDNIGKHVTGETAFNDWKAFVEAWCIHLTQVEKLDNDTKKFGNSFDHYLKVLDGK